MTEHSWGKRIIEIPGLEPDEPEKPKVISSPARVFFGGARTGRWGNKSTVKQPDDDDKSGPARGEVDEVLPYAMIDEAGDVGADAWDQLKSYNAGDVKLTTVQWSDTKKSKWSFDIESGSLSADDQKKLATWYREAEASLLSRSEDENARARSRDPFTAPWPDYVMPPLRMMSQFDSNEMTEAAVSMSVDVEEMNRRRQFEEDRKALAFDIESSPSSFAYVLHARAIDAEEAEGFERLCRTGRNWGLPTYKSQSKRAPTLWDAGYREMSYEKLTYEWVPRMAQCFVRRCIPVPEMLMKTIKGGRPKKNLDWRTR